jgi:hypothetical protein
MVSFKFDCFVVEEEEFKFASLVTIDGIKIVAFVVLSDDLEAVVVVVALLLLSMSILFVDVFRLLEIERFTVGTLLPNDTNKRNKAFIFFHFSTK